MLSSSPSSVLSGACGVLAGLFYSSNFLGMKSWRVGKTLRSIGNNIFIHLLDSNSPRRRPNATNTVSSPEPSRQPPQPQTPEFSEEHVSTLVSMGFNRELALRALTMAGNNLERAASLLLDGRVE